VFSRRITAIQGRVRLWDEFSSGDRGERESRFWIASFYKVIRGRFCFQCKSLALVLFYADIKVSRFDRYAFCLSGLIWIHIFSLVEGICEYCCWGCKSLASVACDPDSQLRPTLSDLLAGMRFEC
jgi:hypothetical protein